MNTENYFRQLDTNINRIYLAKDLFNLLRSDKAELSKKSLLALDNLMDLTLKEFEKIKVNLMKDQGLKVYQPILGSNYS